MSDPATRIENVDLNLFCNLPAQRLPFTMIQQLKQHKKINSIFGKAMFAYRRDDTNERFLPSLCIYIAKLGGQDLNYFYKGEVNVDVYLPLQVVRQQKSEVSLPITEGLLMTFKNLVYFYQVNDVIPWLVKLGFRYEIDLMEAQKVNGDVLSLHFTLPFEMDLQIYWRHLEDLGITVEDLCTPVLDTITQIIPIDAVEAAPDELLPPADNFMEGV